jgi:hypothetical protein
MGMSMGGGTSVVIITPTIPSGSASSASPDSGSSDFPWWLIGVLLLLVLLFAAAAVYWWRRTRQLTAALEVATLGASMARADPTVVNPTYVALGATGAAKGAVANSTYAALPAPVTWENNDAGYDRATMPDHAVGAAYLLPGVSVGASGDGYILPHQIGYITPHQMGATGMYAEIPVGGNAYLDVGGSDGDYNNMFGGQQADGC